MTILSAVRSASIRVAGTAPTALFSSTEQLAVEMADLANDVAKDIAKKHDWQKLTKLATITGDGVTLNHSLPDDYDRMPVKGGVHPKSWITWRYTPARDLDQWLDFLNGMPAVTPGFWIILNNEMNIYPAAQTGDVANLYYLTRNIVKDADGSVKADFTDDQDEFLLDERLLTLALIWRWRAQKRLEYAEDMATYEIALSEEIGRDKGSNIIRGYGRSARWNSHGRFAYPLPLGS